jgi:hypothetical protein
MDPEAIFPWLIGGGGIIGTLVITCVISVCSLVPFIAVFGWIGYSIKKRSEQASELKQASQDWLTTQGTVLLSRVEVVGGDYARTEPRIQYEYTVGAQSYRSERIKAGGTLFKVVNNRDAYDMVDRYPVGAEVTVYYDPANPSQATLQR